jgi:uncharacterized protein YndB with AHSA1/START domain
MTEAQTTTISVDQFIAAPPEKVWKGLTTPELHARWWAPGNIAAEVGHEFHLEMPGWGQVRCEVLEAEPHERFVYTFGDWTLTWHLVPEGRGTRLLLEHAGFDLNDKRSADAFNRMGPGWQNTVLPRLAKLAEELN